MTPSASAIFERLEEELGRMAEARSGEWLRDKLERGSYIYGSGGFGRRILALLREQGFPCFAMIDRRAGAELTSCDGVTVLHPDRLTPGLCQGQTLIVGIFNPHDDMGQIVRLGRTLGFKHIFWGADLPDALGSSLHDMWLGGRATLLDNFDQVRALSCLLADQASVSTLASVIRFRALDGDQPSPAPSLATQYLPAELPKFEAPVCFVDGGAYDGDTFRSLRRLGMTIHTWIAFEPDPTNFARLVGNGVYAGTRSILLPCGLSDRAHQVQFAAGLQAGSRIAADEQPSTTTIQCIALDQSFPDTAIDYIKLDIEGAEAAALRGMVQTVARCRPRLAVSVYHRAEDLWEIPLHLASMMPDADLYLRQHYPNTYDVVAYAVPRRG